MRYIILFLLFFSIVLIGTHVNGADKNEVSSPAHPNLVKNPGFEEGDQYPTSWDRQDDLTTFWAKDEQRGGRCIRCYTRIDNDEFHARREEMKQANPPPPKKPCEIKNPGYEAVGGIDGVSFYSDWIDVKPAMSYTLTADVRSEGGSPKIFVKGYSETPTEIDDQGKTKTIMMKRVTYKIYVDCQGSKEWKSNRITFCPTVDSPDVKWMRVMLFAYWPLGNYWFDNISITENELNPAAPKRWAAAQAKAAQEAAEEKASLMADARNALDYIRKGVERYKADIGSYPPDLDALINPSERDKQSNWTGPYILEIDTDPWAHPYYYKRIDLPDGKAGKGYILKSFGPDGKDGGGDDVE